MIVQLAKAAYRNRHLTLNGQRLVNLYAEQLSPDSKAPITLHGTPGLKLWKDTGDGPIRAMDNLGGVLHVIGGESAHSITSAKSQTTIGTVGSGQTVRTAASDTELVIVGAGISQVISSGSIANITDADFPGAFDVGFVDGYHVFAGDDGQWFISGLRDATDYDALDFLTAEANPDDIIGLLISSRLVWVFGERSVEIYYNSGAADFPFARVDNGVIEIGCAARGSIARIDNTPFWLGSDLKVYRAAGFQPTRISTHAIEYAFSKYATVSDAEAFTYSQGGHDFYVLTFPTENATWCFDAATGLWHERQTYGLGRWRACCGIEIYGKILVGDSQSGKIYELDPETYTDNSGVLQRILTSPPLHAEDRRVTHASFEVQFNPGQGLNTGQGSDPQAMLRYSDDGGYTWSNERWSGIGAIGNYGARARWTRLGQARNRVYEVTVSDPVEVSIAAEAYASTRIGRA